MKTLSYLIMGLLVVLALPACNTAEKYAANNAAAKQWLAANTGTASINVSGRWHAESWGGALLTQTGNKITGTIGEYTANGVVKGRIAYIALSEGGWVYYTVMAKPTSSGTFEGFYSGEVPFSQADQRIFTMIRPNL
jgi:hypothetical protein